jgi:hypothetical protein
MQANRVFDQLLPDEQMIVLKCFKAAISLVYLAPAQIYTVFGVGASTFEKLIDDYPNISDADFDEATCEAINSSMNFFSRTRSWNGLYEKMFNIPPSEVERVFLKWRGLKGYDTEVDEQM